MKRMLKKTMAAALALLMLLSCFAAMQVFAADSFQTKLSGVNPIYAHLYPNGAPKLQDEGSSSGGPKQAPAKASRQRFTSVKAVGEYVRGRMKAREKDAPFTLIVSARSVNARTQGEFNAYAQARVTEIMEEALKHTGNGKEGDYLRFVYGYWEMSAGLAYNFMRAEYEFETDLSFGYYTTAAQENEADAALTALYPAFSLQGKSDYEKLETIYAYLCDNVRYDTEHIETPDYLPQYTAHAALINHVAVCQGYATLFYRMALDNGLDARVIGGSAGGEGHAWNIAKLGGLYYNLDSTWDAGLPAHVFFLQSEKSFADHARDPEYTTSSFAKAYPMAQKNYESPVLNDPALWTAAAASTFSAGSGTSADPYQIASAGELALLSRLVNSGNGEYGAASYCLTADLDLSGKTWVPIGALLLQTDEAMYEIPHFTFSGTFDGNGHTIRNMTISSLLPVAGYVGLFGANRGTVRGLILDNAAVSLADPEAQPESGQLFVGALTGSSDVNYETMQRAEIEDCLVRNAQIQIQTPKTIYCGTFSGLLGESKVWNCFATGAAAAESAAKAVAGGFAGALLAGAGVYLCGFDGSAFAKSTKNAQAAQDAAEPAALAGGFAGSVIGKNALKNCKTEGSVSAEAAQAPAAAGAFFGSAKDFGVDAVCKNLLANCDVLCTDQTGEQTTAAFYGLAPEAQAGAGDWSFGACVNRNGSDFIVLNQTPNSLDAQTYALHDDGLQAVFGSFPTEYWETGADELPMLRLQRRLQCAHQFGAGTAEAPSCRQYGKTVSVCALCGQKKADSIRVDASHRDENGDGKCDVCGTNLKKQGGNDDDAARCKYCHKVHTGLFAPLVNWIHSILYRIFGAK